MEDAYNDTFNFLVVGDWGRNGAHYQREVAGQMNVWSERTHAQFIISTGDNFYEHGVASTSDPLWNTSFEQIYQGSALYKPWYAVLGNHDYGGNVQAQIDYTHLSTRWNMPSTFFKVEKETRGGEKALFIFLDTTPFLVSNTLYENGLTEEDLGTSNAKTQLRWIEDTLKASTAQHKIVTGHHPVYSAGTGHGDTFELIDRLKPLLERYHVQFYLCGHDHDQQHLQEGSTHYLVAGAGSEVRLAGWSAQSKFSSNDAGFLVMSLGGSITARFISHEGNTLYEFTAT